MIAALFVEPAPHGVYQGLPNVDPWDASRDARLYAGPWPVVAHPPCERWGSYWFGGPLLASRGQRLQRGADDGCFSAALRSAWQFGGIIEHPAYSSAYKHFFLPRPHRNGGWVRGAGGWAGHVEQGNYGHRAPKATWLFVVGDREPPVLIWGPSGATGRVSGPHRDGRRGDRPVPRMPDTERKRTPLAFRDLLIGIAESVSP